MTETQEDHRELACSLRKLSPGLLPREVFHEIARLMVTTTFVVVPMLRKSDRTFVLLHRRGADDLYYPSALDLPGTVIRADDDTLSATYKRLVQAELPGIAVKRGPVFVNNVFDRIVRGREVSLIHWIELEDAGRADDLFDLDELPDDIVPTDRHRIEMAAAAFLASS